MAFQFDTTTRNSMATDIANGWAGGTMKVWSGSEPANCAAVDPVTGLLCSITLPNPCLVVASGAGTLTGTWSNTASATGVASFVRVYDISGNCRSQGNVTSDFVINNVNVTSGQPVTVTAGVLTMPGA